MKKIYTTYAAFSIIEVLVGIFVFSLGLVSIYALIASSLSVGNYNKNAIIASNLAREQIELFFNTRDSNYKHLQVWNKQDPFSRYADDASTFLANNYYSLNLSSDMSKVKLRDFWPSLIEGRDHLQAMSHIAWYRLCIENKLYTPCTNTPTEEKTHFYKYLYISQNDAQWVALESGALRLVSKVIWMSGTYSEYDISTIITDWRRI